MPTLGFLPVQLFRLNASHRLLCLQHLTLRDGLRIAPYAITSRPRVVHGFLRAQHFKLRTGHRLLCVRRLALRSNCGLLHSSLCALQCQRIAPSTSLRVLRRIRSTPHSTLIAPPRTPITRHTTLRPISRVLLAPHAPISSRMLTADCSVLNT